MIGGGYEFGKARLGRVWQGTAGSGTARQGGQWPTGQT
jgi:hypothetical protein